MKIFPCGTNQHAHVNFPIKMEKVNGGTNEAQQLALSSDKVMETRTLGCRCEHRSHGAALRSHVDEEACEGK